MKIFIVAILAIVSISASYSAEPTQEEKIQIVTPEMAGKYAVYAMMSANVYHKVERPHYGEYIKKLGWIQVDENGNEIEKSIKGWCGFRYDIYEHKMTNDTVIAFRGTENAVDFACGNFSVIVSPEYKQARKVAEEYHNKKPDRKITFTGHSLGGGLALSVSLFSGFDAVTFNSSPRLFDGRDNINKPAKIRIVIYEDNEILQKIRVHWKKFKKIIPKTDIYQISYSNRGWIGEHSIVPLTNGLISQGAKSNKELVDMQNALANYNATCH